MNDQHFMTDAGRLWPRFFGWLRKMDEIVDTNEVDPLERRMRALEARVEEKVHGALKCDAAGAQQSEGAFHGELSSKEDLATAPPRQAMETATHGAPLSAPRMDGGPNATLGSDATKQSAEVRASLETKSKITSDAKPLCWQVLRRGAAVKQVPANSSGEPVNGMSFGASDKDFNNGD